MSRRDGAWAVRHAVPRGVLLFRVFGAGAQGDRLRRQVQGDARLLQGESGCIWRRYVQRPVLCPFFWSLALSGRLNNLFLNTEILNDDDDDGEDGESPAPPPSGDAVPPPPAAPHAESPSKHVSP